MTPETLSHIYRRNKITKTKPTLETINNFLNNDAHNVERVIWCRRFLSAVMDAQDVIFFDQSGFQFDWSSKF